MFRTGPQVSAQDKLEKQKQKKRLSFRDPEIEGPQKQGGTRSKTTLSATPTKGLSARSSSVEDLSLEDQALHIAQRVGTAFSELAKKAPNQLQHSDNSSFTSDFENSHQEASTKGCSSSEYVSYQRSCQQRNFNAELEDGEYENACSLPLVDEAMRCPSLEAGDVSLSKNCIPPSEPQEARFPSGAQHQIQLLKYQLDQQSQQTQMALHQVQLLTDQAEAESNARRKVQEQNNQLMMQNKALLDHMEKLFQQIEELERQIQKQEKEMKASRIPQEPQVVQRPSPSYSGYRRLSSDQTMSDKPATPNRSQVKKNPLEHINKKPASPPGKAATSQNLVPNRKSSLTSPRQYSTQAKAISSSPFASSRQYSSAQTKSAGSGSTTPQRPYSKPVDSNTKEKDILRIGDTSPPVQSGTMTPFGSGWKLNNSPATEKTDTMPPRNRTGSFSSFGKLKTQDETTMKSSLFNNSSFSGSSSKKYSSSTSDLYNNTGSYKINKSLTIDEPSSNSKSAISNLNLNPPSKLPRFQAYQRKSSFSSDSEQFSRQTYKNAVGTSLFNQ